MNLAEFAEQEAGRMRADLATRDPESVSARYVDRALASCPPELRELIRIRAVLAAYDKRPACPLTPVVLELVSSIADVAVDCGWHMVALGYEIKARRIIGDKEYGSDCLIAGLEIEQSYAPLDLMQVMQSTAHKEQP